ncbi:MAG: hypothetical protein WEA34_13475 [Gemmatimonadota bacterium]
MNRIHVRGVALAMLVAVTACGDSATEVVGDLSQAEAEALAEVVGSTVFSSTTSEMPGAQGAPARTPISGSESVSATVPCELGGTVGVDGSLEYSGDTETVINATFGLTQVHNGCVAESQDGIRFTLDGAPDVTSNVSMTVGENELSMEGTYGGAVDWSTDGREGTCSLDVSLSVDMSGMAESGSVSMSGTVCGVTFQRSVTVG